MKKFIFVGDPHLRGTNPRNRIGSYRDDLKAKVAEIFQLAVDHKVDAILTAGDTWDSPEVTLGVMFDIAELMDQAPVDVYTTIGNHDVYGYNLETYWRTSLRLLEKLVSRFYVVRDDRLLFDDVQITFEPYSAQIDINQYGYSPQGAAANFPGVKIHVAHGMLLDHKPPFDRYTLVHEVPTQADVILTGHEHTGFGIIKRRDGKVFCNPGALMRIKASHAEINRKPQVALVKVDKGQVAIELIPLKCAKPGEDILDRSAIDAEEKRQYAMEQFSAIIKKQTGEKVVLNVPQIIETIAAQEKYSPEVVKVALETIDGEREKMKV